MYDLFLSHRIINSKCLFLVKARLQTQYKDTIPEKIITMALESVDYSEEKALRILDIVLQEDKDSKKKSDKKKGKDGEGVEKNVSFREPRWAPFR